jgi:hypothetical protein
LLIIGNHHRHEFATAVRWLDKWAADQRAELVHCSNPRSARTLLNQSRLSPDLVVWLQSYAGEFSERDLRLPGTPPHQMVCLFGSLCEGELRSGNPLRSIARIPWYAWSARAHQFWPHSAVGGSSQAAPRAPAAASTRLTSAVIGIASASEDMARLLIRACTASGHVARRLDSKPAVLPVDLAIWEDGCDPRYAPIPLAEFSALVAPAPIIAIVNFPRVQQADWFTVQRVARIIAKPFTLEDLRRNIDNLLAARAAAGRRAVEARTASDVS